MMAKQFLDWIYFSDHSFVPVSLYFLLNKWSLHEYRQCQTYSCRTYTEYTLTGSKFKLNFAQAIGMCVSEVCTNNMFAQIQTLFDVCGGLEVMSSPLVLKGACYHIQNESNFERICWIDSIDFFGLSPIILFFSRCATE